SSRVPPWRELSWFSKLADASMVVCTKFLAMGESCSPFQAMDRLTETSSNSGRRTIDLFNGEESENGTKATPIFAATKALSVEVSDAVCTIFGRNPRRLHASVAIEDTAGSRG